MFPKRGEKRVFQAGETTIDLSSVDKMMIEVFGNEVADITYQNKWDIPEELVVIAAPTGAYFSARQNPNQPIEPSEIAREAMECVEAGATSIHIHVRDPETQFASGNLDYFHTVIDPIREKFGDKVVTDGCALYGETFEDTLAPITSGLFDTSPINSTATFSGNCILVNRPKTIIATAQVMQDMGCKPQISVYDMGDIDVANRYLIQTGVLEKPYYWDIIFNLPGGTPMTNPMAMMESLMLAVRRIREIDPESVIKVDASGRASSYLTTLSILMGLHVRVGMEDTIYKYPHKDGLIKSNAEVVKETIQIANLLGRRVATADEYRNIVGIKK